MLLPILNFLLCFELLRYSLVHEYLQVIVILPEHFLKIRLQELYSQTLQRTINNFLENHRLTFNQLDLLLIATFQKLSPRWLFYRLLATANANVSTTLRLSNLEYSPPAGPPPRDASVAY